MKIPSKNRLAMIASLDLDGITLSEVNSIWTKYETGIRDSVRSHGPRYTLDRYKASYAFLRNLILELPTNPIP